MEIEYKGHLEAVSCIVVPWTKSLTTFSMWIKKTVLSLTKECDEKWTRTQLHALTDEKGKIRYDSKWIHETSTNEA